MPGRELGRDRCGDKPLGCGDKPLGLSIVAFTDTAFLSRTIPIATSVPLASPISRIRSSASLTRAPFTVVITSPALMPAFSAAEPGVTLCTSAPSLTPKKSASCGDSESTVTPRRPRDGSRITENLSALGAVNLAAPEELATARERKDYLDAQSQDLTEAVTTLESAIRKIDRETRERLQETFDAVNKHFGEMFPVLFGGGEAKLVMTGEEILDAGVEVIARPPGKRNSTIHLLSGGEKALTALSLVFSMFQLNPAPFCLLDEVDAPLDDSNTERFCDLVKKMSANTQFMFITHNKITMEMASELIGVTMQEQGVSRVVAVDVDEALRMREEAAA